MNQKDIEKLKKFYALATSECNENEATVAARKYVKMIKRLDVNILFYKGQKPTNSKYDEAYIQKRVEKAFAEGREYAKRHEGLYTKQQMDEEWGRGFSAGYAEGERETREELEVNKEQKNRIDLPQGQIKIETEGNKLRFGKYQ